MTTHEGVRATVRGRIAAVSVSCTLCLGPAPPAGAEPSCTDWNTPAFFKEATATDVSRCLAGGADQEERNDDMHRHMPKFQRWLFGLIDPVYSKPRGNSSLHLAATYSTNPSVIAVLLDGGGDLETRDTYGSTPLHHAAAFSMNPSIVAALLEAGADPTARDKFGDTSLHHAAAWGEIPTIVELLLAAGADPAARDGDGRTPLHRAAAAGHFPAVVELLLAAGADPGAKNGTGETAWDLAKENLFLQDSAALQLLRDANLK